MYNNVNSFSEPNFRSQAVAIIARSNWLSRRTKSRCIRLLPDFVNVDQFQALRWLLQRRGWERDFLAQFDRVFDISIGQSMGVKFYALLWEPIEEAVRDLLR